MILFPGATRSGLTRRSYRVGPRELYDVIVSSDRTTVPCVFNAPTVMASGEFPGDVIPPHTGRPSGARPRFPAEATTTRPAACACSTASQIGSSSAGSRTACPTDRFSTLMLYLRRCAIAQSIALMTSLVRPDPSGPSTRRLINDTPGAIPPTPERPPCLL